MIYMTGFVWFAPPLPLSVSFNRKEHKSIHK